MSKSSVRQITAQFMNIENDQTKNAQISHMEETTGLKWYISRVFKYTLDLLCIRPAIIKA